MIEEAEAGRERSAREGRSSSRRAATPAWGWRVAAARKGISMHLRHARQGLAGEGPVAARVRRRGRRLPDRRRARVARELLLGLEPARRGDSRRLQARSVLEPANPQAHYETTGPEIWEQTGGEIDALVSPWARAARSRGAARYLRERNPDLLVVGADPEGSIYSSPVVHQYLVEGIGEDFWPSNLRSVGRRRVRHRLRPRLVPHRPPARPRGGLLVGGLGRHRGVRGRRDRDGGSTPEPPS